MNAFSYSSTISTGQRKSLIIRGLIITLATVVLGTIASGFFPYEESMQAIVVGLMFLLGTGFAVHYSFINGWQIACRSLEDGDAALLSKPALTGGRIFGLAWRSVVAYWFGRWLLTTLVTAATTEAGTVIGMVLGTALMVALGLLLGVRYGYIQARAESERAEATPEEV